MNGACNSTFLAPPLGRSKGQISLNFNNIVNFKAFCVFSQKRCKTFILWSLSCSKDGTWGINLGVKKYFFRTLPCGNQTERGWWVEQNTSKIFTVWSNFGWLWRRGQKVKYHYIFSRAWAGISIAPHRLHVLVVYLNHQQTSAVWDTVSKGRQFKTSTLHRLHFLNILRECNSQVEQNYKVFVTPTV